MPLSRKEQLRCLIIMGVDIRKCQFARNMACSGPAQLPKLDVIFNCGRSCWWRLTPKH